MKDDLSWVQVLLLFFILFAIDSEVGVAAFVIIAIFVGCRQIYRNTRAAILKEGAADAQREEGD